jgi:hypothetical protein
MLRHEELEPIPNASQADSAAGLLRLALLSTPRSGNNWLRELLGKLYQVPSHAAHNPEDVDWAGLPRDCIFAIHWQRVPSFVRLLQGQGFRVIVLARHPLDVLISILQFCWRSPTERWLEGEGGNERPLHGAMPRSAAFLDYATGPRAAALFRVSLDWWRFPGCLAVRYEDLVGDPDNTVAQLVGQIGRPPRLPIPEALAATSLPALRTLTGDRHHFWQGKVGLWKSLLTAPEARAVAEAHRGFFSELGYQCDPDPCLTPGQADRNWVELVGAKVVEDLRALEPARRGLAEAQANLAGLREEQAGLHEQLGQSQRWAQSLHEYLEQSQGWAQRLHDELGKAEQWGRHLQAQLETTQQAVACLEGERDTSQSAARCLESRCLAAEEDARALRDQLRRVSDRLEELQGLGPFALGVARRLRRATQCFPRITRIGKALLRCVTALNCWRCDRTAARGGRSAG